MVVPKPADPPPAPPAANPGAGSGGKPGPSATTTTTAPARLTVAGGGSPPPAGGIAVPKATPAAGTSGSLPTSIDQILRNPNTKRARGSVKAPKIKTGKDGSAVVGSDPSIPDWNDITAALTPNAVAGGDQPAELSLASAAAGHRHGLRHSFGPLLLDLIAAGMIVTVLWGLGRARDAKRPRHVLWL
jgi:hypothetical protein